MILRSPLVVKESNQSTRTGPGFAQVLVVFLLTRLGFWGLGLVAPLLLVSPRPPGNPAMHFDHYPRQIITLWTRFDSGFYMGLASTGYRPYIPNHGQMNWAFFPLYSALMHFPARWLGPLPLNFVWAGLLISNLSLLVACFFLYHLARLERSQSVAVRACLYLLCFPTSFYLSAVYPESLFLALSISSFYLARRSNWWGAGVLAALATLTRSLGIVLVLPLAYEYLHQVWISRHPPAILKGLLPGEEPVSITDSPGLNNTAPSGAKRPHLSRNFFALTLPLLALLGFMSHLHDRTGDYLAFIHIQTYWNRSLTFPLLPLWDFIQHPFIVDDSGWNFGLLNFLVASFFLGMSVALFRFLPIFYSIYSLLAVLLPLSSGSLQSMPRLVLPVFPVFILLGIWGERPNVHNTILVISLLLASFCMILFALGSYAIA